MNVSVFYSNPYARRHGIPVDLGSDYLEEKGHMWTEENFRETYDHLVSVKLGVTELTRIFGDDYEVETILNIVYHKFQNEFFGSTVFPTNNFTLPELGEAANVFPRSMMMGDVIRVDDDYYMVDMVGFDKIDFVGFNRKTFEGVEIRG